MNTFARTDRSLLGRWWWTVDHFSIGAVLLLAAIGMILTMAASPAVAHRYDADSWIFVRRQFVYLPMAMAALVFFSTLSPTGVRRIGLFAFAVALLMTAATLVFGVEVKGAIRWLRFGGLQVQPSEFLKPAFAVTAAWVISEARVRGELLFYAGAVFVVGVVGVVLLKQPDVGTTLLIVGVWTLQVFLAGLPLVLVLMLGCGFVGVAVSSYFLFAHVRDRVDQFFDPTRGEGYQVSKAIDAFHSGGLFGLGPGEGRVKEVLPDAHTDFIFAVAGEEFGFFLCFLLIGLFAFVVLRGFARALKDEDLFVVLAAAGLLSLFGMQALMNLASTMNLIPPKGITLPFISYGGSASIALAWGMGMALALTRRRPGVGDS